MKYFLYLHMVFIITNQVLTTWEKEKHGRKIAIMPLRGIQFLCVICHRQTGLELASIAPYRNGNGE